MTLDKERSTMQTTLITESPLVRRVIAAPDLLTCQASSFRSQKCAVGHQYKEGGLQKRVITNVGELCHLERHVSFHSPIQILFVIPER